MFGQTAIFNGLLTGRISKFLTEAVLHIPGMYKQRSEAKGTGASKSKKNVIFVRRT
jgi:hypothetical protein